MHSRPKILKLEKQRLQAIRKWDVPKLDAIEAELKTLNEEDNRELDAIIISLCIGSIPVPKYCTTIITNNISQ